MAFISAGSGAAANILARRLSSFATAKDLVFVNFMLMTLMLLPAAPFFFRFEFSWQSAGLLGLAVAADAAANLAYFKSFERLPAVTASAILALSSLVTLGLMPLFAPGLRISTFMVAGILLVAAGLVLLVTGGRINRTAPAGGWRRLIWPAAAALLFGFNIYPVRMLFENGMTNPFSYYMIRAPIIAGCAWLLMRPKLIWVSGKRLAFIGGRLVFVIVQWLFLLAAIDMGNPAVVKALADTSPLFVVGFPGITLREEVNRLQVLGVLLTAGGMFLTVW